MCPTIGSLEMSPSTIEFEKVIHPLQSANYFIVVLARGIEGWEDSGGDPSDAIFDASPNPGKGCYTMHNLGNIGHRGTHGTQVKNEDRRPMGECNRRVTKKRCGRKWVGRGWSRKTITQLKQWRIWETQSEVKMFRIVGPSSKSKSVIPWSHRWHGSGGDASPCLDIITLQLYKWQAH